MTVSLRLRSPARILKDILAQVERTQQTMISGDSKCSRSDWERLTGVIRLTYLTGCQVSDSSTYAVMVGFILDDYSLSRILGFEESDNFNLTNYV